MMPVVSTLEVMLISDRLLVSANIGKAISVNQNIGKISYRCITNCQHRLTEPSYSKYIIHLRWYTALMLMKHSVNVH